MIAAPIPDNDADRVASLDRMNLLATAREPDIDRITRLAQRLFRSEIALISLIDTERQWFKSRCGMAIAETGRDISFCGHAIRDDVTFVVTDAHADARFFDNPLVTGGPQIRFYAGQPLTNREGYRIGTLCILSPIAREFSDVDRAVLEDLGRMAEIVLENRALGEAHQSLCATLAASQRDQLLDSVSGLWNRRGLDELFPREAAKATRDGQPLVFGLVAIDRGAADGAPALDLLVERTTEQLLRWARSSDIVARIDETRFVLVASNVAPLMIPILGEKLLRRFRSQASLTPRDSAPAPTISAGFTVWGGSRRHPPDLLAALLSVAETALKAAQEQGGNGYAVAGVDDEVWSQVALA